ncbi:hypothetical protein GCM10008090_08930 [Arenicella chitinivorans]|uniref:Beta-lactamase hydrolase-like protein phosphatase-like domain-containing protein n=1 Tax=Arenicella chitinivorans TaxID=1329800 RepID=A0A918RJ28_9GAMM|nr:protein tyrosine phosphatase family protein [Arenicella chitinivorans]GHA01927.1 hypothetical protein GCM10008090_08930 [Arenicella chitinivorans]
MKHLHQNIHVGGQITAQDFDALAQAGIKVIINNRPDGEEPGQLSHADATKLAEERGMEYHYLPMANGQPLPESTVHDFKEVLDATTDPIFIHCRSGMRSTVIWALGQIPAGSITVDEAISKAKDAGIPLDNVRAMLESVVPA